MYLLKRLEGLILVEERIFLRNPPLDQILQAISIKNGYHSWDAEVESPTLSNINMEIHVGFLVATISSTEEDDKNTFLHKLEFCPENNRLIIRTTC